MADKYLTCPYVPSHQILSFRFQRHLIRCMKNFPANHLKICDFDWNHHVPHDAYVEHLNNCQAKVDCEMQRIHLASITAPPWNPQDDEALSDDWDLDPSPGPYNPKASGKKSTIIVIPSEREVKDLEDQRLASQPPCNVESLKYGSSIPEAKAPAVEEHKMFCAQNLDEQGGRFVGGQRFTANNLPSVAPSPFYPPQNFKSVLGNEPNDTKDLNDAMVRMAMGARPAPISVPLSEKGLGHGIYKDRQRQAIPLASDPGKRPGSIADEPTRMSRGRGMPTTPLASDPGKRPGSIATEPTQMSRGRGMPATSLSSDPGIRPGPITVGPSQMSRGRGIPATSLASDPGRCPGPITVGPTMMSGGRGIYKARQRPAIPLANDACKQGAHIAAEPTRTSRGRGIFQDKVVHQ